MERILANPSILVTLSHRSDAHRKAFKSADVGVLQAERLELCLCVFKVTLVRKAPLVALCQLNLYTAHWNAWHARGVALWPLNRPWPPLSLSFCQLVKH